MSSSQPTPRKVFISYSHDSQEHRLRVYSLLKRLREDGIHCVADHTVMSPPEGWRAWMEGRIKEADFTLVVCTETYLRRAEGKEQPGVGLGVTWEATLITNEIYQNASRNTKFIPVVFAQEDVAHRPAWLRQVSYYRVDLDDGYELLLRHLTNQPLFEEPPVAKKVRELPPITRRVESPKPKSEGKPAPPRIVAPPEASPSNFIEDLNGVKLEMIYIPGGEFTMGSLDYDDEKPPHRVKLSPFFIGKFQVTQAQWESVMGGNPSKRKGKELPVEQVSWDDAVKFCGAISKRTGKTYRLPTEAEWEYACRAGSTTEYCFGDDEKSLGDYAWHFENSGGKPHPVGRKKPNAWGLHDMHGNVWEWCSDWYSAGYYAECERQGVVADPQGPGTGSYRVNRGGGWLNLYAVYCRSAFRDNVAPGDRGDYRGFRLVRVGR